MHLVFFGKTVVTVEALRRPRRGRSQLRRGGYPAASSARRRPAGVGAASPARWWPAGGGPRPVLGFFLILVSFAVRPGARQSLHNSTGCRLRRAVRLLFSPCVVPNTAWKRSIALRATKSARQRSFTVQISTVRPLSCEASSLVVVIAPDQVASNMFRFKERIKLKFIKKRLSYKKTMFNSNHRPTSTCSMSIY
jgi:hypothetical protein